MSNYICLDRPYKWQFKITKSIWRALCSKYNFPIDTVPKYISNGAEQSVYDFGKDYVLKISDECLIIKTSKKLVGKRINGVARCFDVVKANGIKGDDTYCIIQERCSPGGPYPKFKNTACNIQSILRAYSKEEIEIASQLSRIGTSYLTDLHGANFMNNSNGKSVISDYGCIRIES